MANGAITNIGYLASQLMTLHVRPHVYIVLVVLVLGLVQLMGSSYRISSTLY